MRPVPILRPLLLALLALCLALPAAAEVNLNTASHEELVGAGLPAKAAERVIAWRTLIGPFRRAEDLGRVKGIGKATLEKVIDGIGVGDGATVVPGETSFIEEDLLRAGDRSGGRLVNLNTASPEDLASLPGIGKTTARRIVERRETDGPFTAVEELRQLKGFRGYDKVAPLVTVGDGKTIKRMDEFKSGAELLLASNSAEVAFKPAVAGDGKLHVKLLDVEQGDAILVVTPAGGAILVDAGEKPMGRRVVVPALKRAGIRRLNALVLTHAHSDHIGGMLDVLKAVEVDRVYDSGYPATTLAYKKFLKEIEARGIAYALGRDGATADLGEGVTARFLHPDMRFLQLSGDDSGDGGDAASGSPVNINSSVLKIAYGAFSILLTGDIEADSEARLLKRHKDAVRSTVLKSPHHGSEFSSTPDFIAAVAPEAVVIHAGVNNKFNHPHAKALAVYKNAGARVYRTDLSGRLEIVSDGKTWSIAEEHPGGTKPQPEREKAIAKEGVQSLAVKVDLNRATAEDLMTVPGIGANMARRILADRDENGPFRSVKDLRRVRGVGAKIYEKLSPNLTAGAAEPEAAPERTGDPSDDGDDDGDGE